MEYSFKSENGVEVIHFEGNILTGTQNSEILDQVKDRIEDGQNRFIIELGELRFINSTGLSLLISILTKARKAGGEVVLSNIPDELSKLLVMTKLNSIFKQSTSRTEAFGMLEVS